MPERGGRNVRPVLFRTPHLHDMTKKTILTFLLPVVFAVTAMAQTPDDVLRENLEQHVRTLASDDMRGRLAGSEDAAAAAAYISSQFEEIGLFPGADDNGTKSYLQRFELYKKHYANVVGFIPGSDPELRDEYIVLGAHYDHLGYKVRGNDTIVYHGADDNASGVAVLIETARMLKEREGELARTVIIAAFDAEEAGLYGSEAMANYMNIDNVAFMASIDMVGWLRESGELRIYNLRTIENGMSFIEGIPCPSGLNIRPEHGRGSIFTGSDHDSFAMNGIPSILFTTGTKSPYHKPEDTADKIDYDGLELIAQYITGMTMDIATREYIAPSSDSSLNFSITNEFTNTPTRYHLFEYGINASLGSSSLHYPGSSVRGRDRFSWNAGAFVQCNFKYSSLSLRADVLYNHRTFRYPQVNGSGELVIDNTHNKLVSPALTVPVNLLLRTGNYDSRSYGYIGVGGYYSYIFDARLNGSSISHNSHEGGISMTVGVNIWHVGLGCTAYFPLSRMMPDGINMRGNSCFFSVYYKF